MDLRLDPNAASGYTSSSQIAKVVTEAWAKENLYCLACPSEHVSADKPNNPVRDFTCIACNTSYQLKSKQGKHGPVAPNSAFQPKIAAIDEGRVPHYTFLEYRRGDWTVTGLFVVPGHFVTRSVIQRRNPLQSTARRSGWVGSNILLGQVPPEGRIRLVSDSVLRDPAEVRGEWSKVDFLRSDIRASGGWGAEVLTCVRRLVTETGRPVFTLQEFYFRFVEELSSLHPENRNVKAKIRQQLQVLRDGDFLEFVGRGRYRVVV